MNVSTAAVNRCVNRCQPLSTVVNSQKVAFFISTIRKWDFFFSSFFFFLSLSFFLLLLLLLFSNGPNRTWWKVRLFNIFFFLLFSVVPTEHVPNRTWSQLCDVFTSFFFSLAATLATLYVLNSVRPSVRLFVCYAKCPKTKWYLQKK